MKLFLLLLFIARGNVIPSDFYAALDSTLHFAHLSKKDLLFERKTYKEDSFGIHIIDTAISDPVYFIKTGEQVLKNLKDTVSVLSIYTVLAEMLDFKVRKKNVHIEDPLHNLANSMIASDSILKSAFSDLTEEQTDSLLFETTYLFADEDDSTMIKKRGILRITSDTLDSVPSDRYLKLLEKVKREQIYLAGYVFVNRIEEALPEIIKNVPEPGYHNINGVNVYIGTKGNDTFNLEVPYIVIDPEGDDVYHVAKGKPFKSGIIIDLSGNDRYIGEDVSLAGAVFSNNAIFDLSGDDYYEAGIVSLGSGMFGSGILYDKGGENIFKGAYFSEGAGFCGIGILYSEGDDDYYTIWDFGQGFGGTWGAGILKDLNGDDTYRAGFKFLHIPLLPHSTRSFAQGFALGFRPDAHGGIGVLLDEKGNDHYIAEAFAQGTSYWKSLGLLFDLEGNDRYLATEYAQGAGIHLSAGLLFDISGDDHYFSRFGPSQGEGHDYSVGVLMDFSGNDVYHVSGGLGVGLYNSIGIFCDFKGNDVYSTYEKWAVGRVNPSRGRVGIGVFMDLGGKDSYMDRERKNGIKTFRYSGVFYDKP